ncbi:MAG: type II secretion system F family protein [Pseudomonadota bacterium]
MLWLSILCFGLTLSLLVRPMQRSLEKRFAGLERDRLKLVEIGLAKEFFFIEPTRMKKLLRTGLFVAISGSLLLRSAIPLVLLLPAIWFGPERLIRWVQSSRQRKLERQLQTVLPTLSATLRAGHTFERALEALSETASPPISQEFELVLKEVRLGVPLEAALDHFAERYPFRDLEIMVRAVQISTRAGSNLAEAFDRVAQTVLARAALRDRVATLTAQGRLQAWVAIAMPVALTAILQLMAPEYLAPLFESGGGRLLLLVAAVALTIGGIWIHKISRAEPLQ